MQPTYLDLILLNLIDVQRDNAMLHAVSPMPRPMIEKAMRLWGQEKFWQYHGQTECPLTIAARHMGSLYLQNTTTLRATVPCCMS